MSAKTNDTLFLAIGGLAVVGAGIWAIVHQADITKFRTPPGAPVGGAVHEPSVIAVSSPESRRWAPAPSQSAGDLWIYDVFTPPKIFYNTQTRQFTVVPPPPPVPVGSEVEAPPPPAPVFGLQLVTVEQPLFRLQLVGYVGEGDQARGNFLNVETGSVLFGTTGRKFADLNLEVVRFSAERRVVQQGAGTTLVFVEASAVVRDTETGLETKLDTQTRVPAGTPVAVLRDTEGREHRARSGEVITLGDSTFRVGDLTLDPPSAVVTKQDPALPEPLTQTLVIPPPEPPPPPAGQAAPLDEFPLGFPGGFPGF
jgi:hypothetical protein